MNIKLKKIVASYKNSNMEPKLLTQKLTKYYNLSPAEASKVYKGIVQA